MAVLVLYGKVLVLYGKVVKFEKKNSRKIKISVPSVIGIVSFNYKLKQNIKLLNNLRMISAMVTAQLYSKLNVLL